MDSLKRRITQIEIELAALKEEKNDIADRVKKANKKELASLKEQAERLEKHWIEQKDLIQKIQEVRAKIDALRAELDKAEREIDLQKAAEIKYGKIPELEKKLQDMTAVWEAIPVENRVLRIEVDEDDIARVVSRWTGIPAQRMLASEAERIANLDKDLKEKIIGQDKAVDAVARAIKRSRSGLGEKNRPIGTFLFLGPTGVGKTETAKALAQQLFNDEHALIRIDMTEYSEAHAVARLIGAPPGYIGYDEGGQLTEAVRRKPYSVILFDEVEKAHPQVFNIFLQLLDEGRLTDGKGVTVDFRNTIIIMTSNIASDLISDVAANDRKKLENKIWDMLKLQFRPELLNRLDAVVTYNSLTAKDILQIAEQQLDLVKIRMSENNINLKIDEDMAMYFAENGYDSVFGARPLRRLIEEKLVDSIAEKILDGRIKPGDTIKPKVEDGRIVI